MAYNVEYTSELAGYESGSKSFDNVEDALYYAQDPLYSDILEKNDDENLRRYQYLISNQLADPIRCIELIDESGIVILSYDRITL